MGRQAHITRSRDIQLTLSSAPLDWSFPSPATPTNASFGQQVFQTPKTNGYQSHFQDAFITPNAYTTPQQFHYPAMTPIQRPQSSSETLRSNFYANVQAAGSQSAGPSMPPPGPMFSPTNTHEASMQLAMNTSFDSSQMQTPPPTRDTSTRKQQQGQQIAFGTPSTIASRRFVTPQQTVPSHGHAPFPQQSPVQFPQIQFTPDMYQFANFGPASAPVVSQSRILWDQHNSPMQPVPSSTLEDPFAPPSFDMGWPANNIPQQSAQAVSFDTPAMDSFPLQTPNPQVTSAAGVPQPAPAPMLVDIAPAGVDPSLLYSSPIRPVVRSTSRTKKSRQPPVEKERDTAEPSSHSHSRTDTKTSISTTASSTLHRSNTTGTARPKSMHLPSTAAESFARSSSISGIARTASPVKRFGRPPLGSISEGRPRQRTSVILTIDENGRARTETTRIDESPTRLMRDRYPALFDSDSSDAESEASELTPSRPSSFVFEKRDERRAKAARLDPPVENLEGLSIPRSSSAASMKKGIPPSRAAVAAAAQLRRHGSLRRSTSNRNQNRRSWVSTGSASMIDSAPLDMSSALDDEIEVDSNFNPGSGYHASHRNPPPTAESALEAHNRRWSIMSYEQQNGPSTSPQLQQQPFGGGSYRR
jgi:hypothetical protein